MLKHRVFSWRLTGVALALALASVVRVGAQQDTVRVPDLIGLSAPQAARGTADARLLFAGETSAAWSTGAAVQPNLVASQQPAPGEMVQAGSPVKVTVLRVFNVALSYDADNLFLINVSAQPLDLTGVSFESGDGASLRQFRTPNLGIRLASKNCIRLSAGRPKTNSKPADCTSVGWSNAIVLQKQLFWTGENFRILRNGDGIATCSISAGRCDLMLPQSDDPERSPYLSFAYRTTYLTIRNSSERWMGLAGVEAIGWSGKRFRFDDFQHMAPGDVPWADKRLGPGQCIVYSQLDPGALPPYDCQVVGYVKIPAGMPFWSTGFTVISPTGRRSPTCAAPSRSLLSLCLVRK